MSVSPEMDSLHMDTTASLAEKIEKTTSALVPDYETIPRSWFSCHQDVLAVPNFLHKLILIF